jgi:tetratricopeptide (TPR) repeat protein
LSTDWQQTQIARDLYLKCVDLDARYAPAWARLGRCYRVIAKYGAADEDFERAEQAFQRALSLNPDLALAHNLYAHLEADLGRAEQAMVHLLKRAQANWNDPHLLSGLVYACRFCGLLDASIAAHQHARRLDPLASTSVTQSYFMAGEYQQALAHSEGDIGYIDAAALASLGRTTDALDLLRDRESRPHQHPLIRWFLVSLRALLEGKRSEALEATERGIALIRRGGEELYYFVRQLAYLGDVSRATTELERAVENGFTCHPTMVRDSWLDPIRSDQRFDRILRHVESRHAEARRMFVEAGGTRLLSAVKK